MGRAELRQQIAYPRHQVGVQRLRQGRRQLRLLCLGLGLSAVICQAFGDLIEEQACKGRYREKRKS